MPSGERRSSARAASSRSRARRSSAASPPWNAVVATQHLLEPQGPQAVAAARRRERHVGMGQHLEQRARRAGRSAPPAARNAAAGRPAAPTAVRRACCRRRARPAAAAPPRARPGGGRARPRPAAPWRRRAPAAGARPGRRSRGSRVRRRCRRPVRSAPPGAGRRQRRQFAVQRDRGVRAGPLPARRRRRRARPLPARRDRRPATPPRGAPASSGPPRTSRGSHVAASRRESGSSGRAHVDQRAPRRGQRRSQRGRGHRIQPRETGRDGQIEAARPATGSRVIGGVQALGDPHLRVDVVVRDAGPVQAPGLVQAFAVRRSPSQLRPGVRPAGPARARGAPTAAAGRPVRGGGSRRRSGPVPAPGRARSRGGRPATRGRPARASGSGRASGRRAHPSSPAIPRPMPASTASWAGVRMRGSRTPSWPACSKMTCPRVRQARVDGSSTRAPE